MIGINSKVFVLEGHYKGIEGRVIDISLEEAYPITVEFIDGALECYYKNQLQLLSQ
ncbi:hypothetical protein [Brevibacillus antibioticus]|uniref:hypothetical protein n=1 Tax=Brevibacillus antibioticus TaxID=2570228 RepID=UPI0013902D3E|nr:hypothetical protein [Brevibacillus antibioticus]